MKFEHTEVFNFEAAIRGMRNPRESWRKSDGRREDFVTVNDVSYPIGKYIMGANDLRLAQSLIKAGSEHRKFMRQIFASVDITAPLYWWKEFDTYKVGTTANSTSTMHKLASTPITIDCFEMDDFEDVFDDGITLNCKGYWEFSLIPYLEALRLKYKKTKDKRYWKELIRMLPESWLQKRTVAMTYENVYRMVQQRKTHKLTEWSVGFINWAKELPYAQGLLFVEVPDD